MTRRNIARVAALAAFAVGAVGCGNDQAPPASAGDDVSGAVASMFAAEIASIAAGVDGHSVVARIERLPVEGSTEACEVIVEHRLEFEEDRIYLGLTYLTHDPERDPAFPGCQTAPRDVAVDLGSPLASRHVMTQTPSARWVPAADGAYAPCELPACDAATGAAPLPATCDDTTLADAVRSGDVPRHVGLGDKRCELPWAVVDVDVGAGACPATGGGPNPCAGENVRRTYWRTAGYTWEQVGSSTGAGCGDIATRLLDFPLDLCADLPPLP